MTHALVQILLRDLRLALRQGSDVAVLVMFFVITVSLFPFAVGPEPGILGADRGGRHLGNSAARHYAFTRPIVSKRFRGWLP